MTDPQDLSLVAELPRNGCRDRRILQLNASDGTIKRYECHVFSDYEVGWASSLMVEKMRQSSPSSVRYKLRPTCHGPCIVGLGDNPLQCGLGYFALYPVLGPPVIAIPESLDLAMTPRQICAAALEHLYSMAALDPAGASPTVLYSPEASADEWIFDHRTKRIWQSDFSRCVLINQSWTGTTFLSPTIDARRLENHHDTKSKADLTSTPALRSLLQAISFLASFTNNSHRKDPNLAGEWTALQEFLANRERANLSACVAFFAQYSQVSEEILIYPPGGEVSRAPANGQHAIPSLRSQVPPSGAPGASFSHPTGVNSPALVPPGMFAEPSAPSKPLVAPVAKYPKAPGSNAPLSATVLAVAQQAAQALADHKAGLKCNPIVIVNDLYQRLYGVPPTLKDDGRLGGPDHVPRFGSSFTFPSGETICAEGSSKQDAKLNVATRILDIMAHPGA